MRLWHYRQAPMPDTPFDELELGTVLTKFYWWIAAEIDSLENEDSLDESGRKRLQALSGLLNGAESNYKDELTEYWDYRFEKGLPVDLDLNKAPPRKLWDYNG